MACEFLESLLLVVELFSLFKKSFSILKSLLVKAFLSSFFFKADGLPPNAELMNVDLPHSVGPATMRSLFF